MRLRESWVYLAAATWFVGAAVVALFTGDYSVAVVSAGAAVAWMVAAVLSVRLRNVRTVLDRVTLALQESVGPEAVDPFWADDSIWPEDNGNGKHRAEGGAV
jgi:hypothetical protein